MNKTAWMIVCLIGAIAMAGVAIASAVLGGCPGQLELANGNTVPMKCHWTFVADTFIGILGAVVALLGIVCKEASGRRAIAIALIAVGAVAAIMPTSTGIGICAMADMHCNGTAPIVWACSAIAIVIGVIQAIKAAPAETAKPKMSL